MVTVDPELQYIRERKAPAPVRTFKLTSIQQRFLFGFLATLLGIRLVLIFWLPITDTNEARYAEIARKMLETGDWITPQFDYGVPFWGKPPLHTWFSAIGMKVFDVGHFGARLPILLLSFAVLLLCFTWMRRQRGSDQALVGVTVLAPSVLFLDPQLLS
ncbi:phospholipid carrier-dependent glycosyltransferase [Ruegeria sp. 2012CJ41-6]|uniref:Phospholipid carrier-dependent glycosyltransferase n=1 Tax=Ruegeria spongiae TaxID=2942209 RepID=A0ABT0Q7J4_9RHOB|nr:phospholipid carrier-dependent glycosyltransferase [Ruegeria spongiae]MCL6285850.1 phospholipid carrier-dependent glycosyltransferase [Ruegeria spongiae]